MATGARLARDRGKHRAHGYGLAEAKAKLSQIVERAQAEGPQKILRRGRVAAYLISAADWERDHERPGTLLEFFRNSPLWGAGIELERPPSFEPRDPKL